MFGVMQKIGNGVFKFLLFSLTFGLFKVIFGQYFIALIYHLNLSIYYMFGYYLNNITLSTITLSMILVFSITVFDKIKKWFL